MGSCHLPEEASLHPQGVLPRLLEGASDCYLWAGPVCHPLAAAASRPSVGAVCHPLAPAYHPLAAVADRPAAEGFRLLAGLDSHLSAGLAYHL